MRERRTSLILARLKVAAVTDHIRGALAVAVVIAGLVSGVAAATFVVNSTGDTVDSAPGDGVCADAAGACTLRAAITESNALAGTDSVSFAIPGSGVRTIAPASPLPPISQPLAIDGWTQGGTGYTGPPLIELDGTNAGSGTDGIRITAGSSLLRGLVINRFGGEGVDIANPGGSNTVLGCYIGTDATGTLDLGNNGVGIRITLSANNLIGGTTPAERNIISGNAFEGVQILGAASTGNLVKGNYIGTDVTGTLDLGNNHDGIEITTGPSGNQIGGGAPGEGNLISGNADNGIVILAADNNLVFGNLIGTDVSGSADLGNDGSGVSIGVDSDNGTIGGTSPGEANRIAFNNRGIVINDDASDGNSVRGNSVFSNALLGIDLVPFGVTPNDALDADTGPNEGQNYPVILTAASGSTHIQGTLNSLPSTEFALDFYSSASADTSNHGEGETYIGATTVTTDAAGNAAFVVSFVQNTPAGHFITATATDPSGNTSEFSAAAMVLQPTAAGVQVSGSIVNESGRGIARAKVTLTDINGNSSSVIAGSLGRFTFTDVAPGETYVIIAEKKRYQFSPQLINVSKAINDLVLVGTR